MNQNKKGDGWILCSSKTFPGKYYYFNVINGETAWTLTEAEVEKIKNKVHSNYPEPSTKPSEDSPSRTTTQSQPKTPTTPLGLKPGFSFGEPVFPVFLATKDLLNYVWAPVPILYINERNTLSYDIQNLNPNLAQLFNESIQSNKDNDQLTVPVHTCHDQYVSKRFVNYDENFNSNKNKQNKNTNRKLFRKSTSIERSVKHRSPVSFNENSHQFQSDIPNTFQFTTNTENKCIKSPNFIFNSTKNNPEHEEGTRFNLPTNNAKQFGNVKNVFVSPNKTTFGYRFDTPNKTTTTHRVDTPNETTSGFGRPVFQHTPNETNKRSSLKETILNSSETPKKTSYGLNIPEKAIYGLDTPRTSTFGIDTPNKTVRGFDTPRKVTFEIDTPNKTINGSDKLNATITQETQLKIPEGLNNLPQRKRKIEHSTVNDESAKKIKTSYSERQATPKKRVTFNLGLSDIESSKKFSEDDQVLGTLCPPVESIHSLRCLGATDGIWYITTDLDILLEYFNFIDAFVWTDPKCRLMVPYSVYKELTVTSTASGVRARVIAARNVLRRLEYRATRHRVQNEVYASDQFKSQKDQIQSCCLELIRDNIHVVLITNNNILYKEAKEKGIIVFKMTQIRNNEPEATDVTFDIRKIKFQIPNEKRVPDSKETNVVNSIKESGNYKNVANQNHEVKTDKGSKNSVKNYWRSDNRDSWDGCSLQTANQQIKNLGTKEKRRIQKEETGTSRFLKKPGETVIFEKPLTKNIIQNASTTKESQICSNFEKFESSASKKTNNQGNKNQNSIFENALTSKTLESYLKTLNINNQTVEESLKVNADEKVCSLRQILEYFGDILQESTKTDDSRACVLYNILQKMRKAYKKHDLVCEVIDKIKVLLYKRRCINKIRHDISPIEIIQAVACGLRLVRLLQELIPNSEHLTDIKNGLNELIKSIENPIDTDFECVEPEVVKGNENKKNENKSNFVKDESEIVQYLKKHYPTWSHFSGTTTSTTQKPEIKIFRTFGKDLHLVKLNKSKMIKEKPNKNVECNAETNSIRFQENDKGKTGKLESYCRTVFRNGDKNKIPNTKDQNVKKTAMSKFFETFDVEDELKSLKNTEKTEPKVTRAFSNDKPEEKTNIGLKKTDCYPKKQLEGLKNTEKTEPKGVTLFSNDKGKEKIDIDFSHTDHGNTFGATESGPSIVRNIGILTKYENIFKKGFKKEFQNSETSLFNIENRTNEFECNSKNPTTSSENFANSSVIDKLESFESSTDHHDSDTAVCNVKKCRIVYNSIRAYLCRVFTVLKTTLETVTYFTLNEVNKPENRNNPKTIIKVRKLLVNMEQIIEDLTKLRESNFEFLNPLLKSNCKKLKNFYDASRNMITVFTDQAKLIHKKLIILSNNNNDWQQETI